MSGLGLKRAHSPQAIHTGNSMGRAYPALVLGAREDWGFRVVMFLVWYLMS